MGHDSLSTVISTALVAPTPPLRQAALALRSSTPPHLHLTAAAISLTSEDDEETQALVFGCRDASVTRQPKVVTLPCITSQEKCAA
ncbi:hypothetical protein E2C01_048676 [Portunus trituberculatus]|uniref:Uncharacterized protein n=1 Tax=Portunus trituberculatus TaxID=210409 RepID=A0A5B7G4E6_PORTR|nr:hypothetical protein [Portunus trituberculatus]